MNLHNNNFEIYSVLLRDLRDYLRDKKHVYVAAYVILMAANDCCANKTFGCSNV